MLKIYELAFIYKLTFIVKTSQNVESIVREETFVIKGIGEKLSHCRAAHLLVVLMLIDL